MKNARGVRSVRTNVRKCGAIAERDGTPLDAIATSQRPGIAGGSIGDPEMAAIDVTAIRIEEYDAALRREGPLLDFAIARREDLRRAATVGCE